MKMRKSIIALLICLVAALFACGIFSLFIKNKDTITAEAATTTPIIYWGVSGNTLTFSANSFAGAQGFDATVLVTGSNQIPWLSYKDTITNVNFSSVVAPNSTAFWFCDFKQLTTINNFSRLVGSNITQTQCMFSGCTNLSNIDFSNFETGQLTNVRGMFRCCAMETINLTRFDLSKVVDLGNLFDRCSKLKTVVLPTINSPDLVYLNHMFYGCSSLTKVDLSGLEVDSSLIEPYNMQSMFLDTSELKKVKFSESLAKCIALRGHTDIHTPLYDIDNNPYNSESELTKGGGYFTSPHSHSFEFTSQVDATCAVAGSKLSTCSDEYCGKTRTDTIPATGNHSYVAGTVVAPTCTSAGYTTYTCSVCGGTKNDDEVTALNHDWNDWHTIKPATELEAGVEQRECQRTGCDAKETQAIPKLDHTHSWQSSTNDGWVVTKPATCVEQGEEERVCTATNCTLTDSKETRKTAVDTTAHDFDTATWKNNGTNHWHECKRTGCAAKDGNTAHTGGAAATCTTAQTCTVCGFEIAAALGHNYVAEPGGVAPTCTTPGSGKIKCSRCNDEQSGDSIPALGHNFATTWSKDETNHWHKCTRCDEKEDEAAHVLDWVITKTPTETEEGEKEEYCTICDYKTGNKQPIAKLVSDEGGNGGVIDLPTGNDYDLEIAVKESDSLYNVEGVNKGYKVELYVVDGENRNPYDSTKTVTLMLAIPEGMEDTFSLYLRKGEILEHVPAEKYSVEGRIVTIRTTLPSEYVFNAPAPEPEPEGIPWWVWLIVGLGAATLVTVIVVAVVLAKKKRANDDGDGGSGETAPATVIMQGSDYDDAELKAQLAEQNKRLEDLENRDDGGFNAPYDGDL